MNSVALSLKLSLLAIFLLAASAIVFAQVSDQLTSADLSSAKILHAAVAPRGHRNGQGHARFGIAGIDSLVNFNKHFQAPGIDAFGNPQHIWYYNMIGNPPELGGATTVNAPTIPVSVDLRDANGNPRFINGHPLVSDVTPFIQPFLNSPVFATASYGSSPVPTQITDAVQRAEFFKQAKSSWHTWLAPAQKQGRTIIVNQSSDPVNHPNYQFLLNGDGTCCLFILMDANVFENALFNTIVDAINSGDITTQDLSSFLFPNTYLFIGDPGNCCILGFHSYVFDPSNPKAEARWVFDYSSWISPGLFGGGFSDVTALSHEIAESFNDPFVASDNIHNVTPWWLAPNGNCQDDLETGDVIEGLPNGVFPITMNGMTYHPQNEALLQWFEFESPSSAIDNTYSYPNETTLTALSAPQNFGCQ
jgi:hypothetical protein